MTYLPTVVVVVVVCMVLGAGFPLAGFIAIICGFIVDGVAHEQWEKRRT